MKAGIHLYSQSSLIQCSKLQSIGSFSRTEIQHPPEVHDKTIPVLAGRPLVLLEPFLNYPFATKAVMFDSLASALGRDVDATVRFNGARTGSSKTRKRKPHCMQRHILPRRGCTMIVSPPRLGSLDG